MKYFLKVLIFLELFFAMLIAKDIKAKQICNIEIKKEIPNKDVIKKQCLKTAKYYENQKEYGNASWYYLISGEINKDINDLQSKIKNVFLINIAHCYVLKNNLKKAKENYLIFLKNSDLAWANRAIQSDYKTLFKLYTTKKKYLKNGLKLWKEIYKSFIEINNFYLKYEKAKREKKYKEALIYYKKGLKIYETIFGKNHTDITVNYNNIGALYYYIGNYNEALIYYKKALKINKKMLGENNSGTAISYNNIGLVYQDIGNYNKALYYYKKALKLYEKVLGENRTDTATSYYNIGALYYYMGNYQEALIYSKKALKIKEELHEKNYTTIIKNFNIIGLIYKAMGNYQEALKYFKKALEIKNKI